MRENGEMGTGNSLAHFEGRLTARDCKRNIDLHFRVPQGCGQLEIDFAYDPYQVSDFHNLVTLTLFDPTGFRGAGHRAGARQQVVISSALATPGYFAGALPAGEWFVTLDTHLIMPGEPLTYRLTVRAVEGDAGQPSRPTVPAVDVRPRGPGWYRGDLHTHTHHSDADGFSVDALVATARAVGLDFVFLTDHNTTSGLPALDALSSPDLLTCGGIELTTFWGHALSLGERSWVDWRVKPCTRAMAHLAAEAYARGRLFVIAHPASDGDPGCTGCTWRFGDMMPDNARVVEVWNGPWDGDSNNEAALSLWYDWLNQGYRMVATAGTDYHGEPFTPEDGISGPPTGTLPGAWATVGFSVVYAEALTEAALLTAIGAGHCYLSAGPALSLEADDGHGGHWMVGDALPESVEGPVTFTLSWKACPSDAVVRLVANGRPFDQRPAAGEGSLRLQMAPNDADWLVVEVRDARGQMLAITNPIFLSPPAQDYTAAC